jgi:hypothetical protein
LKRRLQAVREITHHKVSIATRIAPEVVQWDNMHVFQVRYQLGLGVKAADKFRVVGVVRQNDLDRNFAFYGVLKAAIDRAKATSADPFA